MEQGVEGRPEQEPPLYYLAARFSEEEKDLSERVYTAAQETIRTYDCELSTYRFKLPRDKEKEKPWFVAAIGEQPSDEVDQLMRAIFSQGEVAPLPRETITLLLARRAVQTQIGPWVERHHGEQGLGMRYTDIKFSRKPKGKRHRRRRHS